MRHTLELVVHYENTAAAYAGRASKVTWQWRNGRFAGNGTAESVFMAELNANYQFDKYLKDGGSDQ